MNQSKKVNSNGRAVPPAAFCETVYMLTTVFCAAVIGALIGLGWA